MEQKKIENRPERLADALYTFGKAAGHLTRPDIKAYLVEIGVPIPIIGQIIDGLTYIHSQIVRNDQ